MRKERRHCPNTGAHARQMAVNVLAVIAVLGCLTMAYLSVKSNALVQGFSELVTGAIAALVALLARTESMPTEAAGEPGQPPAQVEVVNKPDEPVPTTEATAEGE